jgi:hypothetical protein
MASRVQTLRSSTAGSRPASGSREPGELYVNFSDNQIGVIDTNQDPVDLLAIRPHSTTCSYVAGDLVVHNGYIYRSRTGSSPGPFTDSQWDYAFVVTKPASGRSQTIESGAQSDIPLIVKGVPGQQNSLFEIQKSDGTPVLDITPTGDLLNNGHYFQRGFDSLTLNVDPAGSATPADPIGDEQGSGDAFDTFDSLIAFVSERLSVNLLVINLANGTHTGTTIPGGLAGSVVIEGASVAGTIVTGLLIFRNPGRVSNITVNGMLYSASGASIALKDTININSAGINNTALNCENKVRIERQAVVNITHSEAGFPAVRKSRGGGEFINYGTLNIDQTNAHPYAFELLAGTIERWGVISTPGTVKTIYVGASVTGDTSTKNAMTGGAVVEYERAKFETQGYHIDKRTGFMTVWGYASANGGDTVTFNTAFPVACRAVALTGANATEVKISQATVTKTGVTVQHDAGKSIFVYYIAVGY